MTTTTAPGATGAATLTRQQVLDLARAAAG